VTDPRYLDVTVEQMITEFWARYYDNRRLENRDDEEEFEDDGFDLQKIKDHAAAHPDEWVDILNMD
jgi:hypothetical protein